MRWVHVRLSEIIVPTVNSIEIRVRESHDSGFDLERNWIDVTKEYRSFVNEVTGNRIRSR